MNKEIIIICQSIYNGNTLRIANAMAQAINCKLISAQDAFSVDLSAYKVVGLGSGIYFKSHHPTIVEIVKHLSPGQKAFVFSTHGSPFLGKYHNLIKFELHKRNVNIIGEYSSKGFDCTGPFIIIGGGNKGKPSQKDEQRAIKFMARILPTYIRKQNKVPNGQFVYVGDDCIGCGKCKEVCPMNVFCIKENKSLPFNEQECIHCSLCKKNCPTQSISINHSWVDAIRIAIKHNSKTSL